MSYHMKVDPMDTAAFNFFVQIIRKSIEERKNHQLRRNDFIDLMMDTIKELEVKNSSQMYSAEDIEEFIISNAMELFFVGNDTTSGALSLIALNLALHQEVQGKLYLEIKVNILLLSISILIPNIGLFRML